MHIHCVHMTYMYIIHSVLFMHGYLLFFLLMKDFFWLFFSKKIAEDLEEMGWDWISKALPLNTFVCQIPKHTGLAPPWNKQPGKGPENSGSALKRDISYSNHEFFRGKLAVRFQGLQLSFWRFSYLERNKNDQSLTEFAEKSFPEICDRSPGRQGFFLPLMAMMFVKFQLFTQSSALLKRIATHRVDFTVLPGSKCIQIVMTS